MRSVISLRRRERRAGADRPDYAPSRLAYRAERLWLTPSVRRIVRIGLPLVLLGGALGGYFADTGRREAVIAEISEMRSAFEGRPEFAVNLMSIDGASPAVAAEIRDVLPLHFPVSSFDLDLEAMRQTVRGLDAVAEAALRIRPGGVLELRVVERVPALIWKHAAGVDLIDASGAFVAPLAMRGGQADLPLIAGEGAADHAGEAMALLAAARPLGARVLGLVRIGARRWDVVLDREQRILLPETGAVEALRRALALNAAQDMLERDVATVDLRNPQRPTLRLSQDALAEYHRITTLNTRAGQ
ncbi:cell division protein FtsQ/DivIB [Poseidonocella sedimentorum]|uniref:Cell division protein FtsQ n=1 Tax=Poseidonocella sedimentorum TaxID=871652 RepID=A0A1I6CP31_9RHOB|nr:cell division protein FtsQ/DivIB [Poseidonocella sedimentorum]SFQ94907.1 cell division protein FtsQ [Poseidonocella sedimentorum]